MLTQRGFFSLLSESLTVLRRMANIASTKDPQRSQPYLEDSGQNIHFVVIMIRVSDLITIRRTTYFTIVFYGI